MKTLTQIRDEMLSEDVQLGGEEGHAKGDRLLVEALRFFTSSHFASAGVRAQEIIDAWESIPDKWYA